MVTMGSSSSPVEIWRVIGGGLCCWSTVFALLFAFIWQCKRVFFPNRFRRSFLVPEPTITNQNQNQNQKKPSLRILDIVSDGDLKELIDNMDGNFNRNDGWENVVDKRTNLFSYIAKCQKSKDGPLRYMSITVYENCSPKMLRDFYMDNDYRKQWDKTLIQHEQLEIDEINGTEIGRMIKKYPFLTPREYVLGWRMWEGEDKTFYCYIKDCEHPLAPREKKYVRIKLLRSGWRIRKVPDRNACEIKMLHQEDAGLHVEMAKLAFAKGIWSYVCKMDNALRKYSQFCSSPTISAINAITLIQKIPPEISNSTYEMSLEDLASSADSGNGHISSQQPDNEMKLSRRPSKKLVLKGLLVLGGVICLSRGRSSLGVKVAAAYFLTKLTKRNALSDQSQDS